MTALVALGPLRAAILAGLVTALLISVALLTGFITIDNTANATGISIGTSAHYASVELVQGAIVISVQNAR